MKILNTLKTSSIALALSAMAPINQNITAQNNKLNTTTIVADQFTREIPPMGTSEPKVLDTAPNPYITIDGTNKIAKLVIDLSKNVLYKYDDYGNAEKAYLVASGKKSTPTDKGVRIVTHIEKYPYLQAPAGSKRRRHPGAFGPNIICVNKINPINGAESITGEFIHGNNDVTSIGKYASHGCVRMDNKVIQQFAKEIKRGDIVIIK